MLRSDEGRFELWFVRHAESEANRAKVVANRGVGWPLTANGRKQVIALTRRLRDVPITALWSSPLLRAMQTAAAIGLEHSLSCGVADALREYDRGVHEGCSAKPGTPAHAADAAVQRRWWEHGDPEARSEGGESLRDMQGRLWPFLQDLVSQNVDRPGAVICVTHGGLLTCMGPLVFSNVDHSFTTRHEISYAGIVAAALQDGRLSCLDWAGTVPPQPVP